MNRPGSSPAAAFAASSGIAFLVLGCGKTEEPSPAREGGKIVFNNYCSACHHPEGLGVQGGGPPLVGSPWIVGPEARLIRIVLNGVRGFMKVGDTTYNLEMPGFGNVLTDEQVAALLSFARKRYVGSSTAITAAAVSRVRAETRGRDAYWTADELLEVK